MRLQTFLVAKRNLDNKFNGYASSIITCRRDNHDVTNTISQTSSAVSIIIVGLHNIEDIGLTIAYYKSDILSEFIKLYYVSDIIVGLSYLYRSPKPFFQKCNTILTNNSTFVGFRVELPTTIHTYFCVSHYISIPFEIMLFLIIINATNVQ
ncbi:MAG TPA: hypothetical protein VEL11_10750 [Candidatus Bathyarchaeia archaeon]|nr:hypothetical protein [Candidatus Bathyarchaeia archaeon]